MFVYFLYVVFVGEGVCYSFVEFPMVGIIIQQYCVSLEPVSSCTSCLLEISFERVGTVDVYHQSYIGFVDTHSEGICSHHHSCLIVLPGFLPLVFCRCLEAGMIECCRDACLVEHIGNFLRSSATAGIYYRTALNAIEDMYQLIALIGSPPYDIREVLALEAHLKDIEGARRARYPRRTRYPRIPRSPRIARSPRIDGA